MTFRPAKYRNKKAEADGIVFHSKLERDRYLELKLLQQAGEVTDLELQVRVPLEVNGSKVCTWVVDFEYWSTEKQKLVWEDVKGHQTRESKNKMKLAQALYPDVSGEIYKRSKR